MAKDLNKSQTLPRAENLDTKMDEEEIIPGFSTIQAFTKEGFKTLIEATRNSNNLPQERDWDFYNTHQAFRNRMSDEGDTILRVINDILKQQGIFGNIKNRDLEEKVELIIETNDTILERVANNLDELAGIRKNPILPVKIQTVSAELPVNGSWNKINDAKVTMGSSLSVNKDSDKPTNAIRLLTGKNIQRPQAYFKDRIDNSKSPWEPRIKFKPNSSKPLAIFLEETDDGLGEIFCHPYEVELERFEPDAKQLELIKVIKQPRQLHETPLHYVETIEQLNSLLNDLYNCNEIAIDLEHHSYRTYQGITCLMQISTHTDDYLIDTLALRNDLHILNEIFTKPSVVKIFHGADNDILWLQRDLSLYIVNMFDTHQAAKQLGYSHLSLAYLLQRFCQIDANKHFQLADWRIRPLPDELQTYAREDTHYLIYIYHLMRNELLSLRNGVQVLRSVWNNSTQVCRRRYEKPIRNDDSHMDLYRRCKKMFDNRQMFALKHLYRWRDDLARQEDESIGYILPNHMLLQIAEVLPREMQGILACCNPIPPLVRANLLELHKIILMAREQSIVKPILSEESRSRGNTQFVTKLNIDNSLNCPHDQSKTVEFRDDLPTLLGSNTNQEEDLIKKSTCLNIENVKPMLNIFITPDNSDNESTNISAKSKMEKLKFLGPYERYKLVKTYLQAEENKKQNEETNGTDTKGEDRSNEERIAALHKHFQTVATTTAQLPPTDDFSNINNDNNTIPLTMPIATGQKRKRDDDEDNEEFEGENSNNKQQKTNKKKTPQSLRFVAEMNRNNKSKKKRKPQQNEGELQPNEQQSEPQNQRKNNNRRKRQQNEEFDNQSKRGRVNNRQGNNQTEYDNNMSFDYNTIDYRQFQGGAEHVHNLPNIKSNFKSRGQKNRKFQSNDRQNNNRSSTFRGNRSRGGGNFRGGRGR